MLSVKPRRGSARRDGRFASSIRMEEPKPSTSKANTLPKSLCCTTPWSQTPARIFSPQVCSVAARGFFPAFRRMAAVRWSSTLIMALAGMKNPRIVASSLGRKALLTRPVPFARGFPTPPRFRVSVPMLVCRWNVYWFRWYRALSSKVG